MVRFTRNVAVQGKMVLAHFHFFRFFSKFELDEA